MVKVGEGGKREMKPVVVHWAFDSWSVISHLLISAIVAGRTALVSQ